MDQPPPAAAPMLMRRAPPPRAPSLSLQKMERAEPPPNITSGSSASIISPFITDVRRDSNSPLPSPLRLPKPSRKLDLPDPYSPPVVEPYSPATHKKKSRNTHEFGPHKYLKNTTASEEQSQRVSTASLSRTLSPSDGFFPPLSNASLIEYFYYSRDRPLSAAHLDLDNTRQMDYLSVYSNTTRPASRLDPGDNRHQQRHACRCSSNHHHHPLHNSYSEGCLAYPTFLDETSTLEEEVDQDQLDDGDLSLTLKTLISQDLYGRTLHPNRLEKFPTNNTTTASSGRHCRDKKLEIFPELATLSGTQSLNAIENGGVNKYNNNNSKSTGPTTTAVDEYMIAADSRLKRAKEAMCHFGSSIKSFSDSLRSSKENRPPPPAISIPSSFALSSSYRSDEGVPSSSVSSSFLEESRVGEEGFFVHRRRRGSSSGQESLLNSGSPRQEGKKHPFPKPAAIVDTRPPNNMAAAKNRQKLPSVPLTPYQMYGPAVWGDANQKSSRKRYGGTAADSNNNSDGEDRIGRTNKFLRKMTETKADRRRAELKAQIKYVIPLTPHSFEKKDQWCY